MRQKNRPLVYGVTILALVFFSHTLYAAKAINVNLPSKIPGKISVTSNPSKASIFLDGAQKGVTPFTISGVATGRHKLQITKTGYKPYTATVPVTAGRTTTHTATLVPLPGSLAISTEPAGSTVFLNGENEGPAGTPDNPLVIGNLPPGNYQIYLSRDSCPPTTVFTRQVIGGQTTSVNIAYCQEQQFGSILAESSPAGAKVYLNGGYKGITPFTIDRLPTNDTYRVSLEKEGYQPWEEAVYVGPGQVRVSKTLVPLEAGLRVVTDPPGGNVYLDGIFKGTAPVTIGSLVWGRNYVWGVNKVGYQDRSGEVTVRGITNIAVPLTAFSIPSRYFYIPPDRHAVRIESRPAGANVRIVNTNNRIVGEGITPATISFQPFYGYPYKIILSHDGGVTEFARSFYYNPDSSKWAPETICFDLGLETECAP